MQQCSRVIVDFYTIAIEAFCIYIISSNVNSMPFGIIQLIWVGFINQRYVTRNGSHWRIMARAEKILENSKSLFI